jgi:O-antigen/teichoic acid export membrane protein
LKKHLSKKLIKEIIWVVIGNSINILGVLLILKLFTKKLSSEEYGIYYLSLTISIFIGQIFFGPLGNGISRYFAISKEEGKTAELITNSLKICKKTIIILGIFYLVTIVILIIMQKSNYIFALTSTVFFSIFSGFTSIIYSIQNINRERKLVAFFQIIETTLKISLTYFLILVFKQNANTALLANAAASLLIFIIQIWYLNKYNKILVSSNIKLINTKYIKKIINYSIPFSIWGIFAWAQISSDRWFLQSFTDTNAVAKYAVLFQIGYYPLTILMGYIVQVITPILFNTAGNGEDNSRKQKATKLNIKIAFSSLVITACSFIFVFYFHGNISNLLSSSKYIEVSKFLPYMILSGGIFATSQILSLDFLSHLKINQLMAIKISTSIFGILISFFLINKFQFIGAIFSNLSYSIIYLTVISLYIYRRK